MPNWNSNTVTIHAPYSQVEPYLVKDAESQLRFNMHIIFPDKFPNDDSIGDKNWDFDWVVKNTGSKTFPEVHVHCPNS